MSGRVPRAAVLLATAALPRSARARWREELLADLATLPADGDPFSASPWACRVRLHHRFALFSADDGPRYLRCTRCGIDDPAVSHGHPLAGYEMMRVV